MSEQKTVWEARVSDTTILIQETDCFSIKRLGYDFWSYGGDTEFYRYFHAEEKAKEGLKEYLQKEIVRMTKAIEDLCQ